MRHPPAQKRVGLGRSEAGIQHQAVKDAGEPMRAWFRSRGLAIGAFKTNRFGRKTTLECKTRLDQTVGGNADDTALKTLLIESEIRPKANRPAA